MREIKARLMDTVERGISITRIKECKGMIINLHQHDENLHEDREVFTMDSDDEMALYAELDAMTEALERTEEAHMSWELAAAKTFNQVRACVGLCMCVCEIECVCVSARV